MRGFFFQTLYQRADSLVPKVVCKLTSGLLDNNKFEEKNGCANEDPLTSIKDGLGSVVDMPAYL